MFVWIGSKLPETFETELRRHCLMLNEHIGLDTTAFSLPQHISLKISFETDRPAEILTFLEQYLSSQQPFSVTLHAPEQMGNILWLPVAEQPVLQWLHNELDRRLEKHFSIPQHAFDQDFRFHSTLFIDPDPGKITQMKDLLSGSSFPREVKVDTFLLGASENGAPGSYRVLREIKV